MSGPQPTFTATWRTAIVLAALLPVFAFAYAGMVNIAPREILNSDLVQPFMIVRDVLSDPAAIWSWHLSPAIYVFPDCFIALALSAFHLGPVFSMIAYGAVLAGLLTLAGGYVLGGAGVASPARACLAMAAGLFALMLAGFALPGEWDTLLLTWAMTAFIHSGALVSGIALIGVWTAAEIAAPGNRRLYVVSLGLAALASYSDLSFLIYAIIPVAVATGIAWLTRPDRGRVLRTLLLVAVAVAGYMTDRMMRGNLAPGGQFDYAQNIADWWAILAPYLADNPLLAAFFLATPIMLLRALFLSVEALRRRVLGPAQFIEIALVGFQTTSILVPALFGVYINIFGVRYSLPIAVLPMLWGLVLARSWLNRLPPVGRSPLLAAGAWAVALGVSLWSGLSALPALVATPPVVACLNELGRDTAYANYWNAKGPAYLSDYSVHIVQIEASGRRSGMNYNEAWLTRSLIDGAPLAVRTIAMSGLDADGIAEVYGSPSQIETCRDITFWLYDTALPVPPR